MTKYPKWIIATSKAMNRMATGNKNKTVCASLYHTKVETNSRTARVAIVVIDKLFWFDEKHCETSYRCWVIRERLLDE